MITREELLKNETYWSEIIKNNIYNDFMQYINESNLSNKEIAKMLGVSKGRVSQILNGKNLNLRIESLVKISLVIGKIPDLKFVDIKEYLNNEIKFENKLKESKTQEYEEFSKVTYSKMTYKMNTDNLHFVSYNLEEPSNLADYRNGNYEKVV